MQGTNQFRGMKPSDVFLSGIKLPRASTIPNYGTLTQISGQSGKKLILVEYEKLVLPAENKFIEHKHWFHRKVDSAEGGYSYTYPAASTPVSFPQGIGNMQGASPNIIREVYFRESDEMPFSKISVVIDKMSSTYTLMVRDFDGHLRDINAKFGNSFCPHLEVTTFVKKTYDDGTVEKFPILSDIFVTPADKLWFNTTGQNFYLVQLNAEQSMSRQNIIESYTQDTQRILDEKDYIVSDYNSTYLGFLCFFEVEFSGSVILRVLGTLLRIFFFLKQIKCW